MIGSPDEAREPGSVWCVYVPESAGKNFFRVALRLKVWGAQSKDRFDMIRAGDEVLFVHALRAYGSAPSGFPRVPLQGFQATAAFVVRTRVVSDPYYEETSIWPSVEVRYPYRFRFEFQHTAMSRNVRIDASMPGDLRDAIRTSALKGGKAVRCQRSAVDQAGL